MAWFDLLHSALGQPDAYDEARRYLDQQNRANAGAVTGDPDAPFSGSYAQPPGSPPAQPPIGAAAPGPGEPSAYKTPKSWGSILMDLSRQNQQEAQFNRSLGGVFSTISQPVNRERVSHTFDTTPLDPLKFGETAMSLSSQQQGQDRANQIARMVNDPKTGPALAQKLNMPWETLKAGIVADPGLVGQVAKAMATPTPTMANIDQMGVYIKAHGGTDADVAQTAQLIATGMLPEQAQGMTMAAIAWQNAHPGQKLPWEKNNPSSYAQYVANQAQLNKTVAENKDIHANNIDKVTELQHRVEALRNDPGLKKILNYSNPYRELAHQVLLHPEEDPAILARAMPSLAHVSLDPEAMNSIAELRQIFGLEYISALKNLGMSRPTQVEAQNAQSSMSQLQHLELTPEAFLEQGIDPLVEFLKSTRAQSHGGAQDFNNMDEDLKTYVNPEYTKGGGRNIEGTGSEGWAEGTKITPDEIKTAKKWLAEGRSRAEVDRKVRSMGIRPSGY